VNDAPAIAMGVDFLIAALFDAAGGLCFALVFIILVFCSGSFFWSQHCGSGFAV
jgi:hypothetical protein